MFFDIFNILNAKISLVLTYETLSKVHAIIKKRKKPLQIVMYKVNKISSYL